MRSFRIEALDQSMRPELQRCIDAKTKPVGALGRLEDLALQIGLIQGTTAPTLTSPRMFVFAADHGVAREGVSAYPRTVTAQMVENILRGDAAVNVFCRQRRIDVVVVDVGVDHHFDERPGLVAAKVAPGTGNVVLERAMTGEQLATAVGVGARLVEQAADDGCRLVACGEMGIGNTTAASLIMHKLCNVPLEECTGRGTGLSDDGVARKRAVLAAAVKRHDDVDGHDAWNVMETFGGFELAAMAGAMLAAAERRLVVLVDGFIATASMLVAAKTHPAVLDYAVFCHESSELGHRRMLVALGAKPLLNLGLRLGEGTGAALAFDLVQSAAAFLAEMATFASAGVSGPSSTDGA